jgi:hypothetical protein
MLSGVRSAGVTMRHRIRALAAAVILILAGGQALGALHQLLVPHEICAEHGHFVHGQGEASGSLGSTKGAEKPAISSSSGPESHEHHDCCLAARSRDERAVVPVASLTIEVAALAAQQPVADDASTPLSGRSILSFAPKQSPPA